MSVGASRLADLERASDGGSRYRLRDLFTPLDTLLVCGGDPRLTLDPKDRVKRLWLRGLSGAGDLEFRLLDRVGDLAIGL
ncbi:hypothetical protein ACVJGC_007103 [Bradyrhizobium diazoefficiens]